jgi:hypothetical protein
MELPQAFLYHDERFTWAVLREGDVMAETGGERMSPPAIVSVRKILKVASISISAGKVCGRMGGSYRCARHHRDRPTVAMIAWDGQRIPRPLCVLL